MLEDVSTKKEGGHQLDSLNFGRGVVRVGSDGRRWYDPVWKARLVASCLRPGVSVSRQALEHGVNANLLRKWIKAFEESRTMGGASSTAFIPVQICDRDESAQEAEVGRMVSGRQERLGSTGSDGFGAPLKMSASLPNGVRLTLEAGDRYGLAAIIGALSDVQTGR
ncbi:IS66-like element accessory protein TnpA [Asticcacaulis sp. W401b]|uniref:IS66-like element accessory protein TnpA n=1 Tax=Asticcacaulis sp. W401b TaxID=3388666 RepID=UPI003970E378